MRVITNCLIIAFTFSLPAPAATIGYWRFENGDGSACEPELVAVGKPPIVRDLTDIAFPARIPLTGQTNARAIDFGSSQSAHLVRADEPAMRVRGLTVEAFLLRAQQTEAPQYIASQWKYAGCDERSWAFGVAGQQPPTGVGPNELFMILSPDGIETNIVPSGLSARVGAPYYAAASFSPDGVVTFYVRGLASNAEATFTRVSTTVKSLHDSNADFIIGAYDTGGRRWTGLLDEVRLSDDALKPEELLFNAGDWLARLTAPTLEPGGGIFDEPVEIKLASETPGALIHYTTDGSTPTEDSPLYTKPFTIDATATVTARAFKPGMSASHTVSARYQIAEWEYLGNVKPRHSKEITSSNWSVGAETMGRDYTIYANWRTYLGRLGVKKARVQSGWAKTEKEEGVYRWAWLDEIIPDMVDQGVEPWVCLCYGNPMYPRGGRAAANSPLPSSPEARRAWDRFVGAFVQRYGEYVDEWEVWNEPHHQSISIIDMHYAEDGINRKGLLFSNGDQTVGHEKQAYLAVQHLTAIFDDTLERIEEYPYDQTGSRHLSVFGYRHKTTGQQVVTVWFDNATPSDSNACTPVSFTFSRGWFSDPVYVDLRTGAVRAIPEDQWNASGDGCSFTDIPVYDSPILIAERSQVLPQSSGD